MTTQPGPPWTILKILQWTTGFLTEKGSKSGRLDAELLLSHVLNLERIHLYTQFDRPLVQDELDAYRALIKRRANGEPIAYIVGHRAFWTLELLTTPAVLIPRPDTETLVRAALKRIPDDSTQKLVDIGTGTGAIALAIASERPHLQIAATDISADALAIAKENARKHELDHRVEFFHGDLLDPLPAPWNSPDIIVSNPPYIADEERSLMTRSVLDFEPAEALFAGSDGLDIIKRLTPAAFAALTPGGHLLIEIGFRQGQALQQLLKEQGFQHIEILKDYGDQDRVAAAQKPTS